MSLPKTYKCAVFKAAGQSLVMEDAPLKLPGYGEILVKVEACGVCFSDMYAQINVMGGGLYALLYPFDHKYTEKLTFSSPLVPGHEIVGRVAAVGPGVKHWKDGDRIGAGWHGGHDGDCKACKKGMFQMCDNRQVHGETKNGGCELRILSYSRPSNKVIRCRIYAHKLRDRYPCTRTCRRCHLRSDNVCRGVMLQLHSEHEDWSRGDGRCTRGRRAGSSCGPICC